VDLSKLSEDELLAKNEKVMADRAAAEAPYKAASGEIQRELNKRQAKARLDAMLAALPEDQRAELLKEAMGG
jgi:DNA-directed RNA polymerase specialized sigma24 family protein